MKPEEFKIELANISILDIRTNQEWDDFNLGGIHIPLDYLLERISELSKEKKYVVICYNGTQSLIASKLLRSKGFKVENLEGGLEAFLSL
ncbi:rhodanese-like domain-containing protein [Sandaracinomonas limnophila]|nr:rhodanese-like domain-containing protein [Sandaracinomonas limnophila]